MWPKRQESFRCDFQVGLAAVVSEEVPGVAVHDMRTTSQPQEQLFRLRWFVSLWDASW